MTERQKQMLALVLWTVLLLVTAVLVSRAPAEELCPCCGEQVVVAQMPDGNPTPIWQRTPPPTRVPTRVMQ